MLQKRSQSARERRIALYKSDDDDDEEEEEEEEEEEVVEDPFPLLVTAVGYCGRRNEGFPLLRTQN